MIYCPPLTLWFYIARRFSVTLVITITIFAIVALLLDTMELFRILWRSQMSFGAVISMALLKNYSIMERTLPFLMMISSIITYSNLTKSFELVMCRAFGMSVWQFMFPALVIAFLSGVGVLFIANPIGTFFHKQYEQKMMTLKSDMNSISFSNSGVWLHQTNPKNGQNTILHADHISPEEGKLHQVLVMVFDVNNRFVRRVDSPCALYKEGHWFLEKAQITDHELQQKQVNNLVVDVSISVAAISQSAISPETLAFVRLRGLIKIMEQSGWPTLRYQMHFHKMLILPLFCSTMVLVGLCFSTRIERLGRYYTLQLIGALAGLVIYFISDLFYALGSSGHINAFVAASFTPLMSAMAGSYYLLHGEDG